MCLHIYIYMYIWMFSKIGGIPKSSILKGFSIVNQSFLGYLNDGTRHLGVFGFINRCPARIHHVHHSAQQTCDRSCPQPEKKTAGQLGCFSFFDHQTMGGMLYHWTLKDYRFVEPFTIYHSSFGVFPTGATLTMPRNVHACVVPMAMVENLCYELLPVSPVSPHQVQSHFSFDFNSMALLVKRAVQTQDVV